jgi:hypothetical protein
MQKDKIILYLNHRLKAGLHSGRSGLHILSDLDVLPYQAYCAVETENKGTVLMHFIGWAYHDYKTSGSIDIL